MATKIGLTCWGCGWEGRVRAEYAGLRVACKRCRSVNAVPDPVTEEVYVADWLRELGRRAGAVTEEAELPPGMRHAG